MSNYSLKSVIIHNVIRSKRQYIGYLSATSLAIATFFAFGFFLFHPDIQAQLDGDVSSALSQLLIMGQIGVGLFAIFFVVFFHRFLLRLRSKELGLFVILGIPPTLLRRMVHVESTVLAIATFVIGLVMGLLEAFVLFYMAAAPLGLQSFSVHFSGTAILYGTAFFGVLFIVDAYLSGRSMRRVTPKILLTMTKASQVNPRVSWLQLILGFLSLGSGYVLALGFQNSGASFNSLTMLPTAILVSIGTYTLFSQAMIGILFWLRQRTLTGTMLIIISRLAHRARDFARTLTVVTLLHAGVLSLLGVAFAVLGHLHQLATSPTELTVYLQIFSVVLFVFFFLACLFLIAALSTLWVKLFTQLDEDRRQFVSLVRIGLSPKQIRWILRRELFVLFLVPAITAVIHSVVALGEFTTKIAPKNVSEHQAWLYFAYIVASYTIGILLYFAFAQWRYVRSLRTA